MANRHAGRRDDVIKHLLLAALLDVERPVLYAETHAGSATYPERAPGAGTVSSPRDPVAERVHGLARFLDAADDDPVLGGSRYAVVLRDHVAGSATIPGSPAVAMSVLGTHATYLLCDTDPDSTADIERWSVVHGLIDQVATVTADGMRAIARRVLGDAADPATTFVHIDPYDPSAAADDGMSALDLTRALVAEGVAVMYWYGFDEPHMRTWALDELAGHAPLWCASFLTTTADGAVRDGGSLGAATTPGTGSGVVCAHVSSQALDHCIELGRAVAAAYAGVPLPSGEAGGASFEIARG